jgi:hypothetical protein
MCGCSFFLRNMTEGPSFIPFPKLSQRCEFTSPENGRWACGLSLVPLQAHPLCANFPNGGCLMRHKALLLHWSLTCGWRAPSGVACGLASILWVPFFCVWLVSLPPSPLPLSPLPLLPSAHLPTSHSHVCMKFHVWMAGLWCTVVGGAWKGGAPPPSALTYFRGVVARACQSTATRRLHWRLAPCIAAVLARLPQIHRYWLSCVLCCSQSGACMRRPFTLHPPSPSPPQSSRAAHTVTHCPPSAPSSSTAMTDPSRW